VARALARAALERLPDLSLKHFMAGADLGLDVRHAVWTGSSTPAELRELLTSDALARLPAGPSYVDWERLTAAAPAAPWLHRVLYIDLKGSLAEGGLQRVDRASMACSLQVRVPLLDRRVVEVAASLPAALKLRGFTTKHVLKWLVRHRLPPDIVRRPQRTFGVPLARWFRTELRALVDEVCEEGALRRAGLVRAEAVTNLVREHMRGKADHSRKLFTLLVLLLWARRHRVA
jgi:asparagine synthase (glutamine-hydrolysing)